MNINFELVLFIISLVTGVIWAIDHWRYAPLRQTETANAQDAETNEPLLVEYSRFLFPVVLAVLLLRGLVAEPFRIPSGSMFPTLEIGDFILVNKFSYGLRLPVTHTKLINLGEPQRGDVVVFRYPENPSIDYIKRVVGVPGDKIAYYNKTVYVNGQAQKITAAGEYASGGINYKRFVEVLEPVTHDILIEPHSPTLDFVIEVPANKYFVLGDNRDNSRDSRVWGFVPEENLVGKAFLVWMNWEWGSWPKLNRIGSIGN